MLLTSILFVIIILLSGVLVWIYIQLEAARRQLANSKKEPTEDHQKTSAQKDKVSTKQLEQALEESNMRFDLVQRASNEVLYDFEIASGRLQWNDALYKVFGYEHSGATGTVEWWAAHVHPDDAMKLNQVMDGLAQPATTDWKVDYRLQKANGDYVLVHDRSFILRNQAGEATHLIGSIHPDLGS